MLDHSIHASLGLKALTLAALAAVLVAPTVAPTVAPPAAPPVAPPAALSVPSFQLQFIPLDGPPRLVEAGDLDGDDDVDLVVLAQDADTTSTIVIRNHRAAGFGVWWQTDFVAPTAIWGLDLELGDIDEDEDLDLVLNSPQGGVATRFNAGDATFDVLGGVNDQGQTADTELADFDGDDVLDIAQYELDLNGYVGTFRGRGDGHFNLASLMSYTAPLQDDLRIAVGDVTGDGLPDMLLAANSGLYRVASAPNPPFFPMWPVQILKLSSASFRDVTLGDLNGDGRLDVVATAPQASTVAVLLAQPNGTLGPLIQYPAGSLPASVALADLDGDGASDVVVASQRGGTITVLSGTGSGTLLAPVAITGVGRLLTDVTPADLDADGDTDLVVTDALLLRVVLLRNQLVP